MLSHAIRASRSNSAAAVARVAARRVGVTSRRSLFVPSAVRQADLVQDMYLRELKNYKPPPVKPGDAEAHVHKFSPPKPPPSPEEADMAAELGAYEKQAVELEGQADQGKGGEEGAAPVEDWLEEPAEEEEEEGHH
ncbi:ATP synthase complex subunit H-domain-containing protein [Lineolata rhizophorae]|uniref:ATP synthase complex subunit H-domain-containing protein n=1 Tax=Lineolata rhizophorae TaxID=578093 RepID=A0A6A6NNK1_9PEZI|nr:ATP synthase complex subunit H-domain-containing protein [Lineolata rhizophorae]